MRRGLVAREKPWLKALQQRLITTANAISLNRARRLLISGAGHVLRQPVNANSPMQRTNHHEDAASVFGRAQSECGACGGQEPAKRS